MYMFHKEALKFMYKLSERLYFAKELCKMPVIQADYDRYSLNHYFFLCLTFKHT